MEKYLLELIELGGLPSGLSSKDFGSKSVTRNPAIASLLLRTNYIERIGTGINRIKKAVDGNVTFGYDSFFTVVFTREKQRKTSGKTSGKIISLIEEDAYITIPEMATKLKLTERSIQRNLRNLQLTKMLKRVGGAKGGHWEVLK